MTAIALVGVLLLAAASVGTADALERDLTVATSGVSLAVVSLVGFAAGAGALSLPVLVAVGLGRRGRWGDLVVGLVAAGAGAALAAVLEWAVTSRSLPRETIGALTRPLTGVGRTSPLSEVVVACVALLAGASPSQRASRAGAVVVAALAASLFLGGDMTAVAVVVSVLFGAAIGLAGRYALGRQSTRASQAALEAELGDARLNSGTLTPVHPAPASTRRFTVSTDPTLLVEVFDRDQFGSDLLSRVVRLAHLRPGGTRGPALTLRAAVEHRVLMAGAITAAGVACPRPLAVRDVGGDSLMVVWSTPPGTPLPSMQVDAATGHLPDHAASRGLWELVAGLQDAKVAHRGLSAPAFLLGPTGTVALAEVGNGDIAASELALRLDVAQALATAAAAFTPEAAVSDAVLVLGRDRVVAALPVLQPVALASTTRAMLRRRPELLERLRQALLALVDSPEPPAEVDLRRVTLPALLSTVGALVAVYVLVGQLSSIDVRTAFLGVDWAWAAACAAMSALTFAGASLALAGAAPTRLRFVRTYATQLAIAFTGLVAPALVGNVALNGRYLRRAGLSTPAAAGTIALAQVAQFGSYAGLLALSATLAGFGPRAAFTPPAAAIVTVAVCVAAAAVALSTPPVRKSVARRFVPRLAEVLPLVVDVAQQPTRLLRLGGGALLLDASFVAALYCAARATGAHPPVAAVAVVYFAGAILGSAVPTPGGLGGIEAALTGGLIAIGTPAAAALPAVLLYRVATYWLPIPLGWVAIRRLHRLRAL